MPDSSSDFCHNTAQSFEHKIAQIYLASTAEAILFEIAVLCVIFIKAGFSSFTIMQAIGMSLMILLIISAIIHFRKKKIKEQLLQKLNEAECSEEKMLDFFKQNPAEFEFVQALLNPPPSKLKNSK